MTHEVTDIADLEPGFFSEAFLGQQLMISPWMQWVDPAKYEAHLDRLRGLGISKVASCHGVTLHDKQVDLAFDLLGELPCRRPFEWPGQAELEEMHQAMAGAVAA